MQRPPSFCALRKNNVRLYELARRGKLKKFTGISDPYEEPKNPDISINSSGVSPDKLVENIYENIKSLGLIK